MTLKGGILGSLLLSAIVVAQQQPQQPPPEQPTFKVGTQIVSLFATVLDAQKRLVPNLVQSDFEVFDNEKAQSITFFDNEVQPITVVAMLDTSGSMTANIEFLRKAAQEFLLRLLPA